MDSQYDALRARLSHDLIQVFMRVGLVALIVLVCARIFAPFAPIMLWALVLAVTLNPLNKALTARMRGRAGRAATVIVLLGLVLIGVPMVLLGMSFAEHGNAIYTQWTTGTLAVKPPPESVKAWPMVGERVYAIWSEAAASLPDTLQHYEEPLRQTLKGFVAMAASTLGTMALFLGSLIIAGVMMAYGESADRGMVRVARTLSGGDHGEDMHRLSIATMRSVATGVIGVAFIQAILLGIGFLIAGVPGAGLLALITLMLGILQLPALLIILPVLAWLWGASDGSTVFNAFISVYMIVAGMSDGFLKPMLLGRGVDVPMPVVLLGALGGMMTQGMIGLFLGAVILSVGYKLFMSWVDRENQNLDMPQVTDGSGEQ